jgi:hypothetical protein
VRGTDDGEVGVGRADSILDELLRPVKRRVATQIADALTIRAKQCEVTIEASFIEETSNTGSFIDKHVVSEGSIKKHMNVASNADKHVVASGIAASIHRPMSTFPQSAESLGLGKIRNHEESMPSKSVGEDVLVAQ